MMKKLYKRILSVVVIVYGILVIILTASDHIRFLNGGYVQVYATITYVHTFRNQHTAPGSDGNRANGYLEWEYNGIAHEITRLIELPADAEVGELEPIWVDSETGDYVGEKGLANIIFCIFQVGLCVIIVMDLCDHPRKKEV